METVVHGEVQSGIQLEGDGGLDRSHSERTEEWIRKGARTFFDAFLKAVVYQIVCRLGNQTIVINLGMVVFFAKYDIEKFGNIFRGH
jgi:hypothetical protein